MAIKTIHVQPGGGFDRVTVGVTESSAPKPSEITVRIHASSSLCPRDSATCLVG